jgi:hypothetical protein
MMPGRFEFSVVSSASLEKRVTKCGSWPSSSGARSSSMVSTSALAEPPLVQPSPTPNRPVSASMNTSTMRFLVQRVRGFHRLPAISRSISRGVTLVILIVRPSCWRACSLW